MLRDERERFSRRAGLSAGATGCQRRAAAAHHEEGAQPLAHGSPLTGATPVAEVAHMPTRTRSSATLPGAGDLAWLPALPHAAVCPSPSPHPPSLPVGSRGSRAQRSVRTNVRREDEGQRTCCAATRLLISLMCIVPHIAAAQPLQLWKNPPEVHASNSLSIFRHQYK
ncbi:hypothetical protein E2562_025913 [Oryza meyeriana var. granulata]|uniref:Uncharacterized protein n=1 Tax=Oryza meyeriana var. granulata TaxID=110450 RepID=A0A6G1CIK3_9ORYZ|nr:hypothetical protein E2562_025913 [Oryza meyeriana var. granulata]